MNRNIVITVVFLTAFVAYSMFAGGKQEPSSVPLQPKIENNQTIEKNPRKGHQRRFNIFNSKDYELPLHKILCREMEE